MIYIKLRELRDFKGIKQDEMANLLNITRSAYSAYETGKRQMSHESLCILADFFGVTTDYLLGRDEKKLFLLAEPEKEMLTKYRELSKNTQQTVRTLIDIEFSHLSLNKSSKKR